MSWCLQAACGGARHSDRRVGGPGARAGGAGGNGGRARAAAGPNPSSTADTLRGVSAVSGGDAGRSGVHRRHHRCHRHAHPTLEVPPGAGARPSPSSTENVSFCVSAVSGSDAWAAGYYINNTSGVRNTLDVHWDGTARAQVPAPSPAPATVSFMVSAPSRAATRGRPGLHRSHHRRRRRADLALERHRLDTGGQPRRELGRQRAPRCQRGPGSDASAVGYYQNNATGAPANPLILRWNGTAWMEWPCRTKRDENHCSPSARTRVATPRRPGGRTENEYPKPAAGALERHRVDAVATPTSMTVNDLSGEHESRQRRWAVGAAALRRPNR